MIWFTLPRIPSITNQDDLSVWLEAFRREVDRVLLQIQEQGATRSLVGWQTAQTVATGFTVDPTSPIITLDATSNYTSSATEAIKDGAAGQWMLLANRSGSTLTLKHSANTSLYKKADVALAQDDSMLLYWSSASSAWVQASLYDASG